MGVEPGASARRSLTITAEAVRDSDQFDTGFDRFAYISRLDS